MYLKHSVHRLFSAVPKLPDIVTFALFSQIDIFFISKNIDWTLFERGIVLKLSSYRPNNKKK